MEPLKEMFNRAYYKKLANVIQQAHKHFHQERFFNDVTKDLDSLALNQRLRKTSVILREYLPRDFKKAVQVLEKAAPAMPTGYTALVFPDFVGQYGKNDLAFSLDALKFFTCFGSSEFAVREFLTTDLPATLKTMNKWAEDDNCHVRRLASEGSRPRLPWSFRLEQIVKKPQLTQSILDRLKTDEQLYVRKSVANHLNDIGKDNPDYMLKLVGGWNQEHQHTRWIIKHACRTLIKKGDPEALRIFRFEKDAAVDIRQFKLSASQIQLGDTLQFEFLIVSKKNAAQKLVIDYAVHYKKASGVTSRKVFKLKEVELAAGQQLRMAKKQVFNDFSTRVHYAGVHAIELLVNGRVMATKNFELLIPARLPA